VAGAEIDVPLRIERLAPDERIGDRVAGRGLDRLRPFRRLRREILDARSEDDGVLRGEGDGVRVAEPRSRGPLGPEDRTHGEGLCADERPERDGERGGGARTAARAQIAPPGRGLEPGGHQRTTSTSTLR